VKGLRTLLPLAVLAALAVSAAALDAPPAPAAAPRITAEPAAFDFGTVLAGRSVDKEFVIRNLGSAELTLSSVTPTCGCTVVDGYAKSIKPGGSTAMRVRLTASERPGRMQKAVLVKSNDPARPNLEIKIEANVQARAAGR